MGLLLGIDLGTSYFKVGLFTPGGDMKGLGRVAVPKHAPQPGRCELAIEDFWTALRRGLADALAQAGATADEIIGISYSSQASTFLLLDGNDQPLTPLIVWLDERGGPVPPELEAFARTPAFRDTIGYEGLSPLAAPAKWRWFADKAPDVWARTRHVMTISDYFTFALTGERAGDASTAAFLATYDLKCRDWWPDALEKFGVAREQLSRPLAPGWTCGRTGPRAASLLGVPAGVPFAVGALDHHAAAIGSGLERFAEASLSTGTVLAALVLLDAPRPQAGCYHGLHVDGRCWRLAFDAQGAGELEDFQRHHAPERTIEDLLALAARVPAGVAWTGAGSADAGATVRAILERISARHVDLLQRITASVAGVSVSRVVATGGGARSPLWLQITADLLGLPVVTTACAERACLGAAAFAAVAARCYGDVAEAVGAMVRPDRSFEPHAGRVAQYRKLRG